MLQRNGFKVESFDKVPSVDDFRVLLAVASQLWILSGAENTLSPRHLDLVAKFTVEDKHGLYLLGGPYSAVPNFGGAGVKRLRHLFILFYSISDLLFLHSLPPTSSPQRRVVYTTLLDDVVPFRYFVSTLVPSMHGVPSMHASRSYSIAFRPPLRQCVLESVVHTTLPLVWC